MNFGANLSNWFLENAKPLVIMGLSVIGIYLIYKKEFTKLIGFLFVAVIAVLLVFNPNGIKDVLLQLGNKILGI